MIWLQPNLLTFAAAAGIPLLLYLLSRRRLPKIYFSTLRFLKAIEQKQHRRVKVTQWLLILLRMLGILCLVMAFARPLSVGALPVGTPAAAEVAIVMDRSASMAVRSANGTPFDQAVRTIRQLLAVLSPQDHVTLRYTDKVDTTVRVGIAAIRAALDGESPQPVADNIGDALSRAEQELQQSSAPYRTLLLFSDGVGKPDTSSVVPVKGIRYYRWTPPEAVKNNAAIVAFELMEPLLTPANGAMSSITLVSDADKPITATLAVTARSSDNISTPLGEQSVTLPPQQTTSIEWLLKPAGNGPWIIQAELLVDDDITLDNKRNLFLTSSGNRVTLSGDPDATTILSNSFRAANIPTVMGESSPNGLTIHAGARPPSGAPEIWKQRLTNGASLWLQPGPDADLTGWNNWLKGFDFAYLQKYTHVAISLFPLRSDEVKMLLRGWVKSPELNSRGRWSITTSRSAQLSFTDGSPVWCEKVVGKGKLRLDAIPANADGWLSEPLRIPMLARGVANLSSVDRSLTFAAGEPARLPDEFPPVSNWRHENGNTVHTGNRVMMFPQTGIWKDDSGHIAVASLPRDESIRSPRNRFGGIADSLWTLLPNSPESAAAKWRTGRDGREWRGWLLTAALLLLVAESWLGRGLRSGDKK